MRITNGLDRLMRALRTAPLQGSLAGNPGQDAWSDVGASAPLGVDEVRARENGTSAGTPAGAHGAAIASANGAEATGTPAESVDSPRKATNAASVEQPTGLDAHALARLVAASDLVESLGLGFHLGGAVERIVRGASEGKLGLETLREASWLIERYIALVEQRPIGADLHAASVRLNRAGEAIAGLRAISAALAEPTPGSSPSADQEGATAEPPIPAEPDPPAGSNGPPVPALPTERRTFGYEVALMAVRWSIMVAAVIVVVLVLTLLGDWG